MREKGKKQKANIKDSEDDKCFGEKESRVRRLGNTEWGGWSCYCIQDS